MITDLMRNTLSGILMVSAAVAASAQDQGLPQGTLLAFGGEHEYVFVPGSDELLVLRDSLIVYDPGTKILRVDTRIYDLDCSKDDFSREPVGDGAQLHLDTGFYPIDNASVSIESLGNGTFVLTIEDDNQIAGLGSTCEEAGTLVFKSEFAP